MMYDCIPCLLLLGQVAIELLCKNSTSTAKQGISLSYCSLTAALQASSCRDGNTGEILRDIANANSVVALSGLHTANTRLSGGLRPNGTPDTHKYSTHDGRQATCVSADCGSVEADKAITPPIVRKLGIP